MASSALTRFRQISLAEGVSFLLLLGVAMPLKYLAGMPMAVKAVGWVHGVLFIVYVVALLFVAADREWKPLRIFFGLVAAVLPFGPFVFDRHLRREQEAEAPAPAVEGA